MSRLLLRLVRLFLFVFTKQKGKGLNYVPISVWLSLWVAACWRLMWQRNSCTLFNVSAAASLLVSLSSPVPSNCSGEKMSIAIKQKETRAASSINALHDFPQLPRFYGNCETFVSDVTMCHFLSAVTFPPTGSHAANRLHGKTNTRRLVHIKPDPNGTCLPTAPESEPPTVDENRRNRLRVREVKPMQKCQKPAFCVMTSRGRRRWLFL